jgi:predicted DCC family thiol-disulfide oxidoreductase YuxK
LTKHPGASHNLIVYDGECVFCANYVRFLRLRDSIGPVELLDARSDDPRVVAYQDKGYDLDQGMLFDRSGQIYHGSEAVHVLALLCTPSGLFNRVNAWLLSNAQRARVSYPLLKAGRRLTLMARGRKLIADAGRAEAGSSGP